MSKIHLACQYFLNHKLHEDELRAQIFQLARAGYECIYAHSRFGLLTPYFSDSWWKAIDVILEECVKYNIKFGIWDEDGYPSPVAGDRIVSENPDFAAQYLDAEIFEAKAKEDFYTALADENLLLRCYAVYSDGKIEDITSCCGTTVPELKPPRIEYGAYTPVLKMGTPHIRARSGSRRWTIMFSPQYDCKIAAVKISRNTSCHTVDISGAWVTHLCF